MSRKPLRPWTEDAAYRSAADACDALKLSASGVELVSLASAASFRLGDVVIRIAAAGTTVQEVDLQLAFARELAGAGVPAVQPLSVEPFALPGGAVASLWQHVDHDRSRRVPAKAFGRLLREMHQALDRSKLKAPKFDGGRLIGPPLEWIESAEVIDADDVEVLRDRAEEALKRLRKARSELGEGLLHGDAHLGNAVVGPLGPVLLDFENACRGPREWDLIPAALRFERFGLPEREWAAFSEGYGYDVRDWPGYDALLNLSALSETCFTLVNYARFRKEAEKRLRYWRRPSLAAPAWQAV